MKKLSNMIVAVVVFLVMIGALPGCNQKTDNISDIDNVSSKQTKELSPVELTFYMLGEEEKDTQEVLDKVAKASKLNIQLNFEWFNNNDYNEKVVTAINSNDNWDAFLCGKPELGGMDLVQFYRAGKIKDITELMSKYAPNILEQLSKEELDASRVDGKIVMIPQLVPMVNWPSIYVRKDLADKYQISSLSTFNDYEDLLKKIKENDKNIIPGAITDEQSYNINILARAFGYMVLDYNLYLVYKWDDLEIKVIPWEQTPEFKETTSLISRWYKNGYTVQLTGKENVIASFLALGSNIYEKPLEIDLFNDGNPVLYNNYILYKDIKIQRFAALDYYPKHAVAFNSNSPNVERALMFLNWIQSNQKNYDLFMYGIKDKHYTLKGNKLGNPEGIKPGENPYGGWNNNAFKNIKFERFPAELLLPDTYSDDLINFVNKYSKYAPHNGFYPDYTSIARLVNVRAGIYVDKVLVPFSRRTYDTANTESIVNELKQSGSELIAKEVQKQLDRWRADYKK